jgi:hypothetical protein
MATINTKWPQNTYTKLQQNIPNGHKLYQMATKYTNKKDQHLPLQDPTKFTQIGIFGLKMCHMATLTSFISTSGSNLTTS